MSQQNVFSGIRMTYKHVNDWRNYPDFGYFVFQPAIDDMQVGIFTLIAYAVDTKLNVLNGGAIVPTKESNYKSFTGSLPNIQFANNYLSLEQLNIMYPATGPHLDLEVYPAGGLQPYYPGTAYVQYEAATATGTDFFLSTTINPSPPHQI